MIKEIRISNFKSFKDAALPLSRVTFLIGANASGKSNALEVLRFAGWMGHGDRLDDIERKLGKSDSIRGGVRDLFFWGEDSILASDGSTDIVAVGSGNTEFRLGIDVESEEGTFRLSDAIWDVEFRNHERHLIVGDECLEELNPRRQLFRVKTKNPMLDSDGILVSWNNFKRGGRKPVAVCSNRRAIFQQMKDDDRFGMKVGTSPVANAAKAVSEVLDKIVFISPDTAKMRRYVQIQAGYRLDEDCGNLSSVLHSICRDDGLKNQLVAFIRSLPEQKIHSIGFSKTSTNDVMVVLDEGLKLLHPTPASVLSDGTLRALAIGAALFGAQPGATVVIEEIDNGIHPSRANSLVENIYRIAQSRDIQIIVTTHNPALMDAVPTEDLANVLLCYRDSKSHASSIKRLGDLFQFANIAMRGSLGASATDNALGRMAADNPSEKEIRARRKAWLKTFMSEDGGAS